MAAFILATKGEPVTRGETISTAIRRGDIAAMRRMADDAQREEDRMFLALLADLVEQSGRGRPALTGRRRRASPPKAAGIGKTA